MTEQSRSVSWAWVAGVTGTVLALDQATKAWVLKALAVSASVKVVPGFFDLVLTRNSGGVFGLLAGPPTAARRAVFVAMTALALGVIYALLRRWGRESRLLTVALSLVAGGALGNLVDRVRFGSVVDFIDWHWRAYHWYTFNVADSAITCGAALLLVQSLLPEASPTNDGLTTPTDTAAPPAGAGPEA